MRNMLLHAASGTSRTGRFLNTTSATVSGVTAIARTPGFVPQSAEPLNFDLAEGCRVSNIVQQLFIMKPALSADMCLLTF